jgi:hypothetical protein
MVESLTDDFPTAFVCQIKNALAKLQRRFPDQSPKLGWVAGISEALAQCRARNGQAALRATREAGFGGNQTSTALG